MTPPLYRAPAAPSESPACNDSGLPRVAIEFYWRRICAPVPIFEAAMPISQQHGVANVDVAGNKHIKQRVLRSTVREGTGQTFDVRSDSATQLNWRRGGNQN